MPIPAKYVAVFEEDKYYHVYNQTVGNRLLFTQRENYRYFLQKFDEYLSNWIEVDAWCLMGNHFHFLIKVKNTDELSIKHKQFLETFSDLNSCICNQFTRFFTAYAMAFNKQELTKGKLFENSFKRIWVDNENYYLRLIRYIHTNPKHHGIMKDFKRYEWSSYGRILSPKPTKLPKQKILDWFEGIEKYIQFHQEANQDNVDISDYLLDD